MPIHRASLYPGDPIRTDKRADAHRRPRDPEAAARRMWLHGVLPHAASRRTGLTVARVEAIYEAEAASAQAFSSLDRYGARVRLIKASQDRELQHRRALAHFQKHNQYDLAQGALSQMRVEATLQMKLLEAIEAQKTSSVEETRERSAALSEQMEAIYRAAAVGAGPREGNGAKSLLDSESLRSAARDGFDIGGEDSDDVGSEGEEY